MRHTTAPAVLLAASLVACATGGKNFDTSRPLQLDGGTYRQGDQPLLMSDLEDKLAAHPAASSQMGGYQAKKWTGLILGSVGGTLVGWNLGNNLTSRSSRQDWTPALVGAGAIALAIPFGLMADGQLRSAAESYNGSFTQPQSKVLGGALPFIAVLPQPEGGKQCLAGVTMTF
ncbi:MAG TPA: hypothetical protein VF794_15580 [Archangium sp.]|jgi:hypothetical protein|uniref:hypothetical protein n=1 Tax=Archangium sp. TaxID=1872627 RepID=UPI002EDA5F0C